jgi:hypothetical protein
VAFWFVWSSVSGDAAEAAGAEHFPAAILAASHITSDARAALPVGVSAAAVEQVNEHFGRECERLELAYRDIGLRARWVPADPSDVRGAFEVAEPPERVVCLVAVGETPSAPQIEGEEEEEPTGTEVFVLQDVEGAEGGFVLFEVRLNRRSGHEVSVHYTTRDRSARAAGGDYERKSDSLTFDPGELSRPVPVQLLSDADADEGDETFELCLTAARRAQVRPEDEGGCATATIRDGPGVELPTVSVSDPLSAVFEGGVLRFRVELDKPAPSPVHVQFTTQRSSSDQAAKPDVDFVSRDVGVTIPQGGRATWVQVKTEDDDLFELPEVFDVRLYGAVGALPGDMDAVGTILDDDSARRPVVSIADAEASEDDRFITFDLKLSNAAGVDVTVEASTVDGVATAGGSEPGEPDFVALAGEEVLFPAETTIKTLRVDLVDDDVAELAETFDVRLANPTNATVRRGAATGTILDDDITRPQVLLSGGGRVWEGETAVFTLRLHPPPAEDALITRVTVDWRLADGTAETPADYAPSPEPTSGTVVFELGGTEATVEVGTVGDDTAEDDETFRFEVTAAADAEGTPTATVTILDDDTPPRVDVGDAWAREGDGVMEFPVTLSRRYSRAVEVPWRTEEDPVAAHRATPGQDYTDVDSGTHSDGVLRFEAGVTRLGLEVPIIDDALDEHEETFRMRLGTPVGAERGDDLAVGSIRDNDDPPALRIIDTEEIEGETLTFEAGLDAASGKDVSAVAATGGITATPDVDYVAFDDFVVKFSAGSTSATVTVDSIQDTLTEGDETFLVFLGNVENASLEAGGAAIGTIRDDEDPRLTVGDVTVLEGDDATADFVVTLNRAIESEVTFGYATAAVVGGATAGASCGGEPDDPVDYLTVPAAAGAIAAGETELTVKVTLCDDEVEEGDETFSFEVSEISGAVGVGEDPTGATATGTILDDESPPRITIADASADESDTSIDFEVTFDRPADYDIDVNYATADGTAVWSGDQPDYETTTGTLTVEAGETTATIKVTLFDDAIAEIRHRGTPEETNEEHFYLRLTLPAPSDPDDTPVAVLDDNEAVGTIRDDDDFPVVFVYDSHVTENDGTVTVRVELDKAHDEEITVHYRTIDRGLDDGAGFVHVSDRDRCYSEYWRGYDAHFIYYKDGPCPENEPATDPAGFESTSGTLRFPPGSLVRTFDVKILDNDIRNPYGLNHNSIGVRSFGVILHGLDDSYCSNERETYRERQINRGRGSNVPHHYGQYDREAEAPACAFVYVLDDEGTPDVRITFPVVRDRLESAGTLDFLADIGGHAVDYDITISYQTNPILNNCLYGNPEATPGSDYSTNARREVRLYLCDRHPDDGRTILRPGPLGQAFDEPEWDVYESTFTIPAGERTATFSVPIIDDDEVDDDPIEYLQVKLTGVLTTRGGLPNAYIEDDNDPTARGGIIDDDTLPELSVTGVEAAEDGGPMRFRVEMSRPSATDVSVSYATADNATADNPATSSGDDPDYRAATGTLVIKAGDVSAEVDVHIIDDELVEGDETFRLSVTGPAGFGAVAGSPATGTILDDDDDDLPVLTVADAAEFEDSTSRILRHGTMFFELRFSKPNTEGFLFIYGFEEVPSLGEYAALHTLDYHDPYTRRYQLGHGRERLILLPAMVDGYCHGYDPRADRSRPAPSGQNLYFCNDDGLVYRIRVTTVSDNIPERDERFRLWLKDARGVTLGDTSAWGTILNNDQPVLSVANVEVSEAATHAVFTLKLHAPDFEETSLRWRTRQWVDPAVAAAPGEDYVDSNGTVTFAAGETTAEVSVALLADNVDEYDEVFVLQLFAADGLDFANATALARILDDDPGWWIDDASVAEGAGPLRFAVKRDEPAVEAVTLRYTTLDGGATGGDTCTDAGVDYVVPSGSLNFAAGVTDAVLEVTVCDDTATEGGESFTVSLADGTGRRTTATGTITAGD